MTFPLVSVIILTYNSAPYLKNCLDSVLRTSYRSKEIIIVDNASSDETGQILKSYHNKIKVYNFANNLGYAEGNNLGINKSHGKYIFLLNPDTFVEKSCIEPLVAIMEKDSQVGACQPLVRLMEDRERINLTGKVTHYLGFDSIRDYGKSTPPKSGEIISFSGCGVMVKKNVFKEAKAFDPDYFMYYEDSDLSWRLRLFGYKLAFVPKAIIYHDYKYTPVESYQPLRSKLFFHERNRIMTIYKNYSAKTILLILPAIVISELCMLTFSLLDGWFLEKLKGYLSIVKLLPTLNRRRVFIQKNRVLTDKQITYDFTNTLNIEMYNSWGVRFFINPFLSCYWSVIKNII